MRNLVGNMSRIGARPIKFDSKVEMTVENTKIVGKSALGERTVSFPEELSVKVEDGCVYVVRQGNSKFLKSQHGLIARLIRAMAEDLANGAKCELEFKGTGYRVRVEGNSLILNMGYSHEINLAIPDGVSVNIIKNSIIVEGNNRESVGQFAAQIRMVRPPEVYKGKGIKYKSEVIHRKAGKAAAQAGKAA